STYTALPTASPSVSPHDIPSSDVTAPINKQHMRVAVVIGLVLAAVAVGFATPLKRSPYLSSPALVLGSSDLRPAKAGEDGPSQHWQIDAKVYRDRVEEIHYITDPARNIRRRPQTKVWKVERSLGRGAYGESKEAAVFVDFFGWFVDGSDVFLAMEYVPLGDLETNVAAHSGKIREVEAWGITQQILLGLEIMHAESFAHRDLKPQNVLVVHGPPQWWVKLADFGLSKRLTETTAYYTKGGKQSYMAPEILDYLDTDTPSTEYTNAVDLCAVGCITYRLITGIVPFKNDVSLWKYCLDKSLFPSGTLVKIGIIERSCFEFIEGLLEPHPKELPSASQALAHAWGSNTGRRSGDLSQSNQGTSGFSDSLPAT
ncbi:hypothetical protein V502_02156, partial [Pseudogymnoascus sp. VKM F-4520 (FW-2644)]